MITTDTRQPKWAAGKGPKAIMTNKVKIAESKTQPLTLEEKAALAKRYKPGGLLTQANMADALAKKAKADATAAAPAKGRAGRPAGSGAKK